MDGSPTAWAASGSRATGRGRRGSARAAPGRCSSPRPGSGSSSSPWPGAIGPMRTEWRRPLA
eukprot:15095009-Alexandrium_andersonii.AAC.1